MVYLDAKIFFAKYVDLSCFQLPVSVVLGIRVCMLWVLYVCHNLFRLH